MAPTARRGLSLSVATKIFLGFAVVIVAFGATSAFTLARMSSLRQTVTVLWKELTPMSNQLRGLSRQLKAAEEFLALKRANDAQWLQQVLPALEPFTGSQGFITLAERLEAAATTDSLAEESRSELITIASRFRAFAKSPALVEALAGEELPEVVARGETVQSDELYERLVRRTLKVATLGELTASSPETRATARVLRRLNREVNDAVRALSGPIRSIDQRTEQDERNSRLMAVAIAGLALLVSIGMLAIALVTLRPIRKLRAGAQRIAAGDYAERVKVQSSDEIGQLAEEFNRMAASLQQRDLALVEKQKELVAAERLAAVGRLAAQITHEVRNPLSSIGLNAELLEEELDEVDDPARAAEAKKMLASIAAEVQRLKDITEQYLQLTRLARSQQSEGAEPAAPLEAANSRLPLALGAFEEIRKVDTDLVALVRRFASFLGAEAAREGVRLEVIVAREDLPPVPVDPDPLRQALLNLSKNSLEALRTVSGEKVIRIRVSDIDQESKTISIRIEDNGPGFPEALEGQLFEPFVTDKPHGTGLGLAVTRDILRGHGGEVRVERAAARKPGASGAAVELVLPWSGPSCRGAGAGVQPSSGAGSVDGILGDDLQHQARPRERSQDRG